MTAFRIERLASHDRQAFACGEPALDRYFREQVIQDAKRRLSACFVAVDGAGEVAGFYTLAAASLPLAELPEVQRKRLPRYGMLPACLIGRLAVATWVRGQKLGAALVVDALSRAARAEPAIYAMIVDAKDATAASFYAHLGFIAFASRPKSLFLPLTTALKAVIGSMHGDQPA